MDIETDVLELNNVAAADVERVFGDQSLRGDFVILSRNDTEFIQVAGEGDGPYLLEYREGERLFRATDHPNLATAKRAFLSYLAGESAWRDEHHWQKAASESGCLGQMIRLPLFLWSLILMGR